MSGQLAWCERLNAAGNTWHLRRLTERGRQLGGGIDTPSLCGRVPVHRGWDIDAEVDQAVAEKMAATIDHTGRQACQRCVLLAFLDEPKRPVTAGELAAVLATYPADAPVWTSENGGGGGDLWVEVDGETVEVWGGWTSRDTSMHRWATVPFEELRPKPYEPKEII